MSSNAPVLAQLSSHELVAEVTRLAGSERAATAALIAALSELDARRLYLAEGYPSLFAYCTQCLHYSEHAAYHRIEAARAAQRFPLVLERLQEGSLTLTAVGLLRPHLTVENQGEVLDAARHQGKRAIEELAARLHARPDVRASVRKLPDPAGSASDREVTAPAKEIPALSLGIHEEAKQASVAADSGVTTDRQRRAPLFGAPSRPPVVRALAPARYQVQMALPRAGVSRVPSPGAVCRRGEATMENISLACRQHNQWEAERYYSPGEEAESGTGCRSGAAM